MKTYGEIFEQVKSEMGEQLDFYIDENANMGIVTLPFRDNLGDNFVVRIGKNDVHFILDDAGLVQNTLFMMSQTLGGLKASRLVNALVRSFDAHFDRVEGVIGLVSGYDEVESRLLHFLKLLITIDTMLVEVGKEEKEAVRPYRQSLGPRASQRIRKSIKPLIDIKKVNHRVEVSGISVSNWLVDFAYKPTLERLAVETELVVLISVDLAVLDPIFKATYAHSRATDIRAAHRNYDIRIAYDAHGQNSNAESGANFLRQHEIYERAYSTIDLSSKEKFVELVRAVNRETGMPFTD